MIENPSSALERCLATIRARNAQLNALVWVDEAGAQNAARSSDERHARNMASSPVDGLPIVVKANVAVMGAPWTAALLPYKDRVAKQDATVVAQLRKAGAVIVGVANMHEGALGATTTSPLYGPARHPRNAVLTPGGSSGGSAVATASGMAAAAIGTDTMGSVRLPSSYCGIAGFKPSFGRVSRVGVELLSWSLDHVGFHAATAAQLRPLVAAIRFDLLDPYAEAYSNVFLDEALLTGLRIAIVRTTGVALQDGVSERLDAARATFAEAGARLSDISLELDLASIRRRALLLCEAEFASLHRDQLEAFLAETSPQFRDLITWGATQGALKLATATAVFGEARLAARRLFSAADVAILPTTPHTAFPIGDQAPESQADLTVFANVAGLPAATVNMGMAKNGLPVGLQILGPRGADGLVLSVAEAFERAIS